MELLNSKEEGENELDDEKGKGLPSLIVLWCFGYNNI
jgi:hypothetical protein